LSSRNSEFRYECRPRLRGFSRFCFWNAQFHQNDRNYDIAAPRNVEIIPISLRICKSENNCNRRLPRISNSKYVQFIISADTRISGENNRETDRNKWKLNDESAAAVHTVVIQSFCSTERVKREKKKKNERNKYQRSAPLRKFRRGKRDHLWPLHRNFCTFHGAARFRSWRYVRCTRAHFRRKAEESQNRASTRQPICPAWQSRRETLRAAYTRWSITCIHYTKVMRADRD